MSRTNRCDLIDESKVGIYHCVNRCVRQAFLCGQVNGNNYDYRRQWIQQRVELLAGIFVIDVIGFSVLSNHFHLVLRNRPDLVAKMRDREVAWRWWNLFPTRLEADGSPAEPQEDDIKQLIQKRGTLRKRLSSISWLMRCLAEKIAKRANKEDETKGRFFEGRFRSQEILDESALLACLIYVDLNPVRAELAETPEASRFTSAYERIRARRQRKQRTKAQAGEPYHDEWMAPVELDVRAETRFPEPQRRCSNRGFLSMTLDSYLTLLDWSGRQVRADKPGAIPADLAPILERLNVSTDCWVDLITGFGRWFRQRVGRPSKMDEVCRKQGGHWLQGISHARNAFN